MKKTAVSRIVGDLCLYFSVLSIFPAFQRWQLPMAAFVAACALVGLSAVESPHFILRLLLSLLPGLCFLLMEPRPLLFFPALAWLYFILVMSIGNFGMAVYEYRQLYSSLLAVGIFFVAANLANSAIYQGHMISVSSLIYVFLFFALGIVSLRQMQMGARMDRRWQLANALTVLAAPLAAVAAAALLYGLFRLSEPLWRVLFAPLGRFILWLFNLLFGQESAPPVETPEPTVPLFAVEKKLEEALESEASYQYESMEDPVNTALVDHALSVGVTLAIVLAVLFVIYLVVRAAKLHRPAAEEDSLYEQTEFYRPERRRRRKKNAPVRGNAYHIRKLYREYLEYLRENGLSIHKANTSQDVLEASHRIVATQADERLRQLYLSARYGDPDAVSAEDVRDARQCVSDIILVPVKHE